MAEALFVGALVSGSISLVLNRLISPEFVNSLVSKKLDRKLVERLKTALLAAEALAADAEQKQFGNDRVRKWLDSLRDALYTAEDLLDRVFIKAQIRKKVRVHLPLRLNLSVSKIVTKINEMVKRIEDLQKLKDSLGLKEIPTGSSSWRPPSTSLVKGNVYGRDGDQQALIRMLNDNNDHNLSVISILGMGGVGKTTLAQCLYNNEALMEEFDPKAWICVSENFDVVETTKNVIKEINSGDCSLDSFESLQQDLKKRLSEKKFFIVLDDVWSEDADMWNTFITPFHHGRKGSAVLLTTRKENVCGIVRHYYSYPLKELSDDYCWSIFADNASFPESNGSSELEGIGRKIVERCDGLPLAAETLGRMLRSKHDAGEWNKVLSSDIWQFSMIDSKIVPALLISYYHLPAHLKRCFVYCSLYPKDHEFDKDELILLWMAEDLLRPPRRGETLEEVGCECFAHLASRLFFKRVQYSEKYFVMHDLMHDLATFLAGDLYYKFSEELGEKEEMSILTHHLSYDHSIPKKICSSSKIESLRTLLYIKHGAYTRKEPATLPGNILSKNKYLRVLSFDRLNILPDSIDKLIQLRYLGLSGSGIEVLPQSLCNMCNLQTLKLEGCSKLTMLPNGMYNLVNLRHLNIRRTHLKKMPTGMGKLPRGMNSLLPNLQYLDIRGCPNICRLPEGGLPPNLKELRVGECEEQVRGLSWLGNLDNLTHLTISGLRCESIKLYPEVGWLPRLPSLTTLHIHDFHNLETLECNQLLGLTSLQQLHISDCPNLKNMEGEKLPSSLQQLHISWCHKLENIAGEKLPPSLLLLQIYGCHLLGEHCKNKHQQIWSKISHICTIQVDDNQIF
ncbi:Putative disease resistance RPP13-like protein [Arachis hypogaea]|nr:Putative disease resistance RPP13-like protein [Arachis hypogaea]